MCPPVAETPPTAQSLRCEMTEDHPTPAATPQRLAPDVGPVHDGGGEDDVVGEQPDGRVDVVALDGRPESGEGIAHTAGP